jgi:hypothetical protein
MKSLIKGYGREIMLGYTVPEDVSNSYILSSIGQQASVKIVFAGK